MQVSDFGLRKVTYIRVHKVFLRTLVIYCLDQVVLLLDESLLQIDFLIQNIKLRAKIPNLHFQFFLLLQTFYFFSFQSYLTLLPW